MTITTARLTAAARESEAELRAEAIFPCLDGESKDIARFNAFYRRAAEVFLERCTKRLPTSLPAGRYLAKFCCTAAWTHEGRLCVHTSALLCRRGRSVAAEESIHRWAFPGALLLPEPRPPRAHGKKKAFDIFRKRLVILCKMPKN